MIPETSLSRVLPEYQRLRSDKGDSHVGNRFMELRLDQVRGQVCHTLPSRRQGQTIGTYSRLIVNLNGIVY